MMIIRLAFIHTPRSTVREVFEPALRDMWTPAALTILEAAPRRPFRTLRQLLAARPQIVVAQAGGSHMLAAMLYRVLRPRSRLLLCAIDAKPRRFKLPRHAAGVVTDPNDARRAVERLRAQFARQTPSSTLPELDLFRFAPPVRAAEAAHRLLFVGDLSPTSLALDVLIALAHWAETHPHRMAEIWWAGDGDLSGVLAAQPLPPNLAQQFHGTVAPAQLAELMARSGVLVASAEAPTETGPLIEALAAGLVVLASRRMTAARLLLQAAGPGWLFDPAHPTGLADALEQVLASDTADLDRLRVQGQQLAHGLEIAAQDCARPIATETLACSPLMSGGVLT